MDRHDLLKASFNLLFFTIIKKQKNVSSTSRQPKSKNLIDNHFYLKVITARKSTAIVNRHLIIPPILVLSFFGFPSEQSKGRKSKTNAAMTDAKTKINVNSDDHVYICMMHA